MVGAGLFSRGRGRSNLFHCISFRGGFRYLGFGFRASSDACLVFVLVLSCAFLSALVHLVPLSRLVERCGCRPVPLSRVSRRGGGAAAGGCLLVRSIAAMGRAMLPHFVPFLFLACSLRGAGRRGVGSSVSSCLLGVGASVDVRCPVPAPIAVRLLAASAGRCGGNQMR